MYSLGAFPFIKSSGAEKEITVELYSVSEKVFANLDMLEGYPNFYDRKLVKDDEGNEGWIYFIDKDSYSQNPPHVVHGDWVKYLDETDWRRKSSLFYDKRYAK